MSQMVLFLVVLGCVLAAFVANAAQERLVVAWLLRRGRRACSRGRHDWRALGATADAFDLWLMRPFSHFARCKRCGQLGEMFD